MFRCHHLFPPCLLELVSKVERQWKAISSWTGWRSVLSSLIQSICLKMCFLVIYQFLAQVLLRAIRISFSSSFVMSLSLSITSVSVTLTEQQQNQTAAFNTSLTSLMASMDEEISSHQFRLFIATGAVATSVQINGNSDS